MKFAIILSGCGQHDGSETHEAILTLLSLSQQKIDWEAFAPDIKQHHVTNHFTGETDSSEQRNVLKESARLVRGRIEPLSAIDLDQYDAIIVPGGAGAITTLSSWVDEQEDFAIQTDVGLVLAAAAERKIPVGFICIAPMLITKLYENAKLTIGDDKTLAKKIKALGCQHVNCAAEDIVIDEANQIVSTPANMVANENVDAVYQGIYKLVQQLVKMVH